MSRKAFAYHQQRREGARVGREEGRVEESEDAARPATAAPSHTTITTTAAPSTSVATPLPPPPPVDFSTLSTPSTEDSHGESSAALRKRLLESKLPVSNHPLGRVEEFEPAIAYCLLLITRYGNNIYHFNGRRRKNVVVACIQSAVSFFIINQFLICLLFWKLHEKIYNTY